MECVHHTEELPAKKVMEVVSKRKSTSPEDKMFAKILEAWNEITDADDDKQCTGCLTGKPTSARGRRWWKMRCWPGLRRGRIRSRTGVTTLTAS